MTPALFRRVAATGLTLSLTASAPRPLRAASAMSVSVEGCPMSSAEVTRLVQLELSSVLAAGVDSAAYRVTLRCDAAELHISLFDPITQKSLARTVLAPPKDHPEPERLVALTVAQLYRAAWLELTTDETPTLAPARSEEPPPEQVASARRAAERMLGDRQPPVPSAPSSPAPPLALSAPRWWSLGVALGARVRHAEAPVILPSLEVAATWRPAGRAFWLFTHAGMEWADVARKTGMLETLLVRVAAGAGVEPLSTARWSAVVEAAAGLTHLTLSGHASRAPYAGRQLAGPGFDASLGLGVAARFAAARIELVPRIGILIGTPTGVVAGDEDLSLDGLWMGADLRFKWQW